MRLAWCDAVVLPLWVLVTLFAIVMIIGDASSLTGAALAHSPGFVQTWFDLSLITVLPLWLFLRAVDLATGGPWRRRGSVLVRPIRY